MKKKKGLQLLLKVKDVGNGITQKCNLSPVILMLIDTTFRAGLQKLLDDPGAELPKICQIDHGH